MFKSFAKKAWRVLYAIVVAKKHKKAFQNSHYINSKGWSYLVHSAPWDIFKFASTEICYNKYLIRLQYRTNQKSYWINSTSSQKKLRSNLQQLWTNILRQNKFDYVLIITDGDCSINAELDIIGRIIKHSKCRRIYCQNLVLDSFSTEQKKKLRGAPIGLDLHTKRQGLNPTTALHCINKLAQTPNDNKNVALIDFKLSISSPVRREIIQAAEQLPSFEILESRLNQEDLWTKYTKSAVIVSPPGGGLDCHRTWEALYLGCEVFVFTKELKHLFKNNPRVVIIENLDDLKNNENRHTVKYSPTALTYKCFVEPSDWQFLR